MVLGSFSRGYSIAKRTGLAIFLPLLLDLILMPGRESSLRSGTTTYGVMVSLPIYFPSLSNIYNFPSPQNLIQPGGLPIVFSSQPIFSIATALLFTAVIAFLSGGYLGVINQKRMEFARAPTLSEMGIRHPRFLDLCITHFVSMFEYGLLWLGIVGLGAVFILLDLFGFAIAYFLLVLVFLTYFLFLTPFAIVVDGAGLGASLKKSVRIASKTPGTLGYVIVYVLITLPLSAFVYVLMNGGIGGYAISALIYSVIGTILVSATLEFYSDAEARPLRPKGSEPAPIYPETNNGGIA